MDLEKIRQRREEKQQAWRSKWICHSCVKKRYGKNGELLCRVLYEELGKSGKCWSYSNNLDFFLEVSRQVANYRKSIEKKKVFERERLKNEKLPEN